MPARDFRTLLAALDARGELVRADSSVRAASDIAAATAYNAAPFNVQNRPVLFNAIEGSAFRAAANMFSTHDRLAFALNVEMLDEIRLRLNNLFDLNIPRGSMGLMERMGDLIEAARSIGIAANTAPKQPAAQAVVSRHPLDARVFPAFRYAAGETHPSFTAAVLIFNDQAGTRHIRATRAVLIDADTLAVQVEANDRVLIDERAPYPAAVILGADPALLWSAGVPLPGGFDRAMLAAWIRGKPVPFVHAVSIALEIPADAEVIFEGALMAYQPPSRVTWCENDGGLHDHDLIAFSLSAITHREKAIIPILAPNGADAYWMRRATERLFLPLLKAVLPGIDDFHHISDQVGIAAVSPLYLNPERAHRVMAGLWGMIPGLDAVVVVPAHLDIHDLEMLMRNLHGMCATTITGIGFTAVLVTPPASESMPACDAAHVIAELLKMPVAEEG
ncbi:MAG: UbiD family decarboxylase [bacterium]|nr:UbiD family decarboxylase [bacterium]